MLDEGTLSQADIEQRVDDWMNRISSLYSSIKEWLNTVPSYTTKEQSEVTMYEELMQKYKVSPKKLTVLDIYAGDKIIATFKPIGLWIVGANGRVDFLSKKGTILLVDKSENFQPPSWFSYKKNRNESTPFNKEDFLNMLKVIEDEHI